MEKADFFTKPMSSHQLSTEFLRMCESLHFRNLQDILAWRVGHLLKLDGFTYHHYDELLKYLNANGYKSEAGNFTTCQV